jgi:hypothetical protein
MPPQPRRVRKAVKEYDRDALALVDHGESDSVACNVAHRRL